MSPLTILVHCRRSPYSDSLARTGIELAMAAAAFEQAVAVLFSGDGVWQLMGDQQPAEGTKHHGKLVSALPVFGVEGLYVEQQALAERGLTLDDLCVPATPIDIEKVRELISGTRCVYNF